MILYFQPFPELVLTGVNPCLKTSSPNSWCLHAPRPKRALAYLAQHPHPSSVFAIAALGASPAASLPLCLCASVPLCLCAFQAIMQNKPNSQNPKTRATSCPPKTYTNLLPSSPRKNKPNFPTGSPAGQSESPSIYTSRRQGPLRGFTLPAARRQGPKGAARNAKQIEAKPRSRCTSGPNPPPS